MHTTDSTCLHFSDAGGTNAVNSETLPKNPLIDTPLHLQLILCFCGSPKSDLSPGILNINSQ